MHNFKIVLCEIFNKQLHGFDDDSDASVLGHYLISYNISRMVQENELNDLNDTKAIVKLCKSQYSQNNNNYYNMNQFVHPIIRNYNNIVSKPNYIQLQIAKVIYLSGQECVAILKTFWIKLIQRAWKKVYKKRCNIIALRKLPETIYYKQSHNKWPDSCYRLPSLKGLLLLC